MAEILIKAGTNTTYSIDDVVIIQEDGYQWGLMELNTDIFRIVHFPNKTKQKLEYLTDEHFKTLKEMIPIHIIRKPKMLMKMIQRGKTKKQVKAPRRYQIHNNTIIDKKGN